jgi:hypothetical protein
MVRPALWRSVRPRQPGKADLQELSDDLPTNGFRVKGVERKIGSLKTPKPAGGLDRCLPIRFLRVISVVEHRKPTESVEAEIQPSDGFPYRRTESRIVPHLLSWHSGGRPLFGLSYFRLNRRNDQVVRPKLLRRRRELLPRVSITGKTGTSRSPVNFLFPSSDTGSVVDRVSRGIHLTLRLG